MKNKRNFWILFVQLGEFKFGLFESFGDQAIRPERAGLAPNCFRSRTVLSSAQFSLGQQF